MSKYKMDVAPELLSSWQTLRRRNDVSLIMALSGLSKPTVLKALNYGHIGSSQDLPRLITKFFNDRLESEKSMSGQLEKNKQ